MRKLFLSLFAAGSVLQAMAQAPSPLNTSDGPRPFKKDSLLPHWVVDVNLLGGVLMQDLTTANTNPNYLNGLNLNTGGNLKFTNGMSYGFDAQLGYFFGHSNHFGVGAGFMYLYQQGDVAMSNPYHAEYQATDYEGNVYRQVVTSNQTIQEKLSITNMNIPIVLKYKTRFSKRLGFTADAGALINLQLRNSYTTNASFDYEAIYQYTSGTDTKNGLPTVYDNSPTPSANDVFYTKAEYLALHNNNSQYVQQYFNTLRNTGYNVGLGVKPNSNSGAVSYTTGTVGLLIQPSLSYFLSDNVALNFGLYYIYQPFTNNAQSGYMLTNKAGDYSSMLNSVTASNNQTFGLNIGVRFFIGNTHIPQTISYIDKMQPTACNACDGGMVLHGLPRDKKVEVMYNKNGSGPGTYATVVSPDGSVRVPNLCAGHYSGITAKIRRRNITGGAVDLADPVVSITSQSSTNPTANGTCDGTITLHGSFQGRSTKVTYNFNGAPQSAIGHMDIYDNVVTITGLCEGEYTNILLTSNNCKAQAGNITLSAPPPPPPPPPPVKEDDSKISTPILFELNRTVIHKSSYPVLDEAYKRLSEDKEAFIIVDGYTDITGKPAYNKKLSLKRATAVKNHLVKMGISPKRIKIVGHGAKNPAGDNTTPEGRMLNRRAVMKLNVGE